MWHVWESGGGEYKVVVDRMKERNHLKDWRWKYTIEVDLKKQDGSAWTGLIWLCKAESGGLL